MSSCKACLVDIEQTKRQHFHEDVICDTDAWEDMCPKCLSISQEAFIESMGDAYTAYNEEEWKEIEEFLTELTK